MQNLTALSLFGISRGVDVDLALLEPCHRLEELTLRSCRNVACIPPLPRLRVLKCALAVLSCQASWLQRASLSFEHAR